MTRPLVLHACAAEYSARTLLVPQLDFLSQTGFDVRLACSPDGEKFGPGLERFGPLAIDFSRHADPVGMARAGLQFARTVRELKPDLVHLHSSSAGLAVRALPRRLLGKRRPKIVFTVHGYPFLWSDLRKPKARALELMERQLARRTDAVLFQSQEDLDGSTDRRYKSMLRFLGNGVQDDWFHSFPPIRSSARLRLLFVGRLIRPKGVLDFLEAGARVPDVELVVAGGRLDSERDDISKEIDLLARDPRLSGRLQLLGSIRSADMPSVVASADMLVLPSAHEGVPRSIIEAMSAGRAVITTDVRGCRELVEDGVGGWIVPVHDVDALEAALRAAVATPRDRLREMGAAGQAIASARYRESEVVARIVAAYAELGVRPG